MNKIFYLVLGALFSICLLNSAQAESWKIYSNKKLGYKIQYPAAAVVETKGLNNIRNSFYFDPLQPITDLQHLPQFESITIIPESLAKFSWADKHLIVLSIDHVSDNLLPPDTQPVIINNQTFYQQHSWEAGMCHNYDYYTYYLPKNHKYYVFIFLQTANCYADEKQPEKRYNANIDTKEFEKILASFQSH